MKKQMMILAAAFAGAVAGRTFAQSVRIIPFANDADSEISTSKTYTHALNFG